MSVFQVDLDPMVYSKREVTQNTLLAPSVAADVIKCKSAKLTPFVAQEDFERVVKGHYGNDEIIYDAVFCKLDLEVYIGGAGTAGDAPPWGTLHTICGYSQTLDAGTDARYALVTGNTDTNTFYVNYLGNRHPIHGCRGSVSRKLDANKVPYFHYEIHGVFNTPVAAVDIQPDWAASNWQKPVIVGKTNTTVATLHGIAVGLVAHEFKVENSPEMVNVPGYQGVDLGERKVSSSIEIPAPLVTTKDWYSAAKAGTTGSLIIEHGTVAGNIVRFENAKVGVFNPQPSRIHGNKGGLKLDLNVMPSSEAGNNEELIIVK
ncbi:MAG: hypothetical protein DHS20C12_11960 [Pseudohongiella sp.]|nr:MAG: hypothetical protein DHS20C12_11960 [Pseudohongiella sp.]